jgi:hypothetical protein
VPAGDYDHALHVDDPTAPSILEKYLEKPNGSKTSETPEETTATDETDLPKE